MRRKIFPTTCLGVLLLGSALFHCPNATLAQSLRFQSIQRDPSGRISIQLESTPGKTYQLESSSDLRVWSPLLSRTADRTTLDFSEALQGPSRFFRASEVSLEAVAGADQFSQAGDLKGSLAFGKASNAGASSEAGEPDHSWFDPGKTSVWWKWTAPASGRASVSLIGTHFETLVAVYSGPSVGALQTAAKNRRSSKLVSFDAKAGVTYFIAVAGHFDATGEIRLALQLTPTSTAAAPKSVAGVSIFFDETSNPNIPLRVTDISADGLWWQDRDNGSADAVDLGTVLGYTANASSATLALAAHRANETNTIQYTFTFDTPSTGGYAYSVDGIPAESGRFANFRDARAGLAPASLARTVLHTVRTRSSLGSSGQRHILAFGWAGDFHDSDGQEHGSGSYVYSAADSTGSLKVTYTAPPAFAGDSQELQLKFAASTHGTFVAQYRRNDGTLIEMEGDFVLEFVH